MWATVASDIQFLHDSDYCVFVVLTWRSQTDHTRQRRSLCDCVSSGSTEEEDKRLGFVAPVLFFILALQTGLSGLDPEERLVGSWRTQLLI